MTRPPDSNREVLEKAVLSCLINRPDQLDKAVRDLGPEPFRDAFHQGLFTVLKAFHAAGRGFDLVALARELAAEIGTDPAGVAVRIGELALFVVIPEFGIHYQYLLKEANEAT